MPRLLRVVRQRTAWAGRAPTHAPPNAIFQENRLWQLTLSDFRSGIGKCFTCVPQEHTFLYYQKTAAIFRGKEY